MKLCNKPKAVEHQVYTLEVPRDEALNSGWERPVVKNTKGLTILMPRTLTLKLWNTNKIF